MKLFTKIYLGIEILGIVIVCIIFSLPVILIIVCTGYFQYRKERENEQTAAKSFIKWLEEEPKKNKLTG